MTCDHAANVDCQAQPKPEVDEADNEDEEDVDEEVHEEEVVDHRGNQDYNSELFVADQPPSQWLGCTQRLAPETEILGY